MKQLQLLMGMPITVEIVDPNVTEDAIENVFAYFSHVDDTFSTYKEHSEISKINRGELCEEEYSDDMKTILALSEQTKQETQGYFDIQHNGIADPSGIVKGWAILKAAQMLQEAGWSNFYIDAGGDIQVSGTKGGNPWRIGIRNPFNRRENVKVLTITDKGIATSGTAIRGQHIYDPHRPHTPLVFSASSFFTILAAPLNHIPCAYLLGCKFVTRIYLCSANQHRINIYYCTHPCAYHRSHSISK